MAIVSLVSATTWLITGTFLSSFGAPTTDTPRLIYGSLMA
jgi:hypothetical protein